MEIYINTNSLIIKTLKTVLMAAFLMAIATMITMQSCKKDNLISNSTDDSHEILRPKRFPWTGVEFDIKSPKSGCEHNWGLCNGHGWIFGFQVFMPINPPTKPDGPNGGNICEVQIAENMNNIKLRIYADSKLISDFNGNFEVGKNMEFNSQVTNQLNVNSVKLISGNYSIVHIDGSMCETTINAIIN